MYGSVVELELHVFAVMNADMWRSLFPRRCFWLPISGRSIWIFRFNRHEVSLLNSTACSG